MAAMVNVNGRISDEREAVISVFDHGFLYGEGVYETLRTYNSRLFLYDRHMRRLRNSARMIELVIPFTDEVLTRHVSDTIGATSSGLIACKRPDSSRAFASSTVSVTIRETPYGNTVLARIPCGAPSRAMTLVSPTSPAFAAA